MHRRVALLSVAALALAGALVPAQAQATGTADHRPVRWSGADSSSERRTVLQYWTTQRMMAAQPMDTMAAPRRATRSGGPTRGEPWAARGDAARTGQRATQRTPWRTQGSGNQARGAQTQQAVPNSPGLRWTDGGAVVRTSGRLFFTTAEGANASCSGTAVTSANESVVMTAGHCVKLNGAAHRNVAFVPAFDNGRRPFGTWVATRLFTTQQWNAREDINFDIAAAVVAPLQGRTLTDVVGGQGVAFNQARQRQMFAFGYPAAAPFDGSTLIYCSGRAFNDPVATRGQGVRCNMTGGSSGGGWFLGFNESTGLGMLNSVNSFTYDFAPGFMFGPFFGDEAMEVYQAAQNSGAL
ncbi:MULTISPECIES: trypsin-like serine peptidase [Nonomuraea]|uniref:Peptidase n=1 Tax=Nonomuraea ferruginea TaxID=46174 RepID=A0ABT4T2Y6_9ACTN|nr:peptidase [Nonomuraea ferruginea]MDA0643765.1 peptidase [Nonomuraea ferruginea]